MIYRTTVSCTRAAAGSIGLNYAGSSISLGCFAPFFPPLSRSTSKNIPSQSRLVSQFLPHTRSASAIRLPSSRSILPPSRSFTTSSSKPASTTTIPTPKQPSDILTWNAYLSLRQKRRYYNLTASILAGFGTFAGGLSFLMTQDLEKLSALVFGIDPVFAMGICGLAFGALGWLVGPFAGDAVFRLLHRRVIGQMSLKEKDLYSRIKRYRCDPSAQSVSNPVPDYYGEKISSVQGYRQWLKDQRAFGKKRGMAVNINPRHLGRAAPA